MTTNTKTYIEARSAFLPLIVLCAILTGCASSPTVEDGERAIQDRIKEQSNGRIKLITFRKTNGAKGEFMGLRIYALEFDAEIEFIEDCKWIIGTFGQQLSFGTSRSVAEPRSGFGWNKFLDDTQNPGALVKKGQRKPLSGVLRFVKKESGWSVDSVELSRASQLVTKSENDELRSVINALRLIDGAKQEWALEKATAKQPQITFGQPPIDWFKATPSEADLKPHLHGSSFPVHPPGGRYMINAADQSPESSTFGKLTDLQSK